MELTTIEGQISNPTFLVVDDKPELQKMSRMALDADGYTNILTAESVEEADTVIHDFAHLLSTRNEFNRAQAAGEAAERPRLTFAMYKALGMLAAEDSRYLGDYRRTEEEKAAKQTELLDAVTPEKEDAIIQGLSSFVIGLLDRQISWSGSPKGFHPCVDQHRIIRSAEDALGPEHIARKLGIISMSADIFYEEDRQSVPEGVTVAAGPTILKKPFDMSALFAAVDDIKQKLLDQAR